ncbi:hypothetical protein [Tardiphaga sp.]|jgi:hypothetical protein|uniref:hypothetical protein n=1 Tax=Tardiphaga sp. TaxID=1926292 RepID=UPI0037DA357A
MSKFIDGIGSLFSGPDTSAADAQARKSREEQQIALARSRQDVQGQEAETDQQLGRASRAPKGRRLLLAATGESGVSSSLGGN